MRIGTLLLVVLGILLPGMPSVMAAPPTNDDFDDAVEITSLPFTDTQRYDEATRAPDDPSCWDEEGATVWYAFTPSEDTWVRARVEGSNAWGSVSVWTGSRGSLDNVLCGWPGLFEASGGQTYYLMVTLLDWEEGPPSLTLSVEETGPPPPPMDFELTIDNSGRFDSRTGAVTLSGTAICSTPGSFSIWGEVRQRAGRTFVYGWYDAWGECDGVTPWTATLYAHNGIFAGGPTTASASGWGSDDFTEDYAEVSTSIRLRGARNP